LPSKKLQPQWPNAYRSASMLLPLRKRILALSAIPLLFAVLPTPPGTASPLCFGRVATLVNPSSGAHIRGTSHADVIVTGPGDDVIAGGGGDDRICSGGGRDRIVGGVGRDSIDAGSGDDSIEGGNGSDRVKGGPGTDVLIGNRGNDRLFGGSGDRDFVSGGLGDDTLSGGAGSFDQIIGGIGNDKLYGGAGEGDVLRGDRGADLFDGGPGVHDEASFSVSGENGLIVGGKGIVVDLSSGTAENDGRDRLTGIEDVVGTPFHDTLIGDAGVANDLYGAGGNDELRGNGPEDRAFGGPGSDTCSDVPAEVSCGPEPLTEVPRMEVDLAGGSASATMTAVFRQAEFLPGETPSEYSVGVHAVASFEAGVWIFREEPLPIVAGDRCSTTSSSEVRCPVEGKPEAVFLDGTRADDWLEVDENVPRYASATLRGEYGTDTLVGGRGDDSLDGSPSNTTYPNDVLKGRGGDDALTYGALLDGGTGSDLLIASICSGEHVDGGPGVDSVSFARTEGGVEAKIGGGAVFAPVNTPHQHRPAGCGGDPTVPPTHIENSVERIEGSRWGDVLIGNDRSNTLLGRGGDDKLLGGGGDDILVGGQGSDQFFGQQGFDRLYARDGRRDQAIDCGKDSLPGGAAEVDGQDPPPRNCR
jgi:Ca2+-binding RTX toxin-like protein